MATLPSVDSRPGSFGLTTVGGVTGWFIRIGQLCLGDGSRYAHAFVNLGDGTCLEAMPLGARIAPVAQFDGRRVAYSWPVVLTGVERARIVAVARTKVGVRYGFTAYLHLALAGVGVRWGWLIRHLETNGRAVCSQLVDQVYSEAGVQLFDDGRAPHDVTPGDLANALIERDWRTRVSHWEHWHVAFPPPGDDVEH